MTSNAIKVDARQYRRKHGCEPTGRFLWTFRIGTREKLYVGENGKAYPLYFTGRGEYEEILAAAILKAEEKGAETISVSSVVYGQEEGR